MTKKLPEATRAKLLQATVQVILQEGAINLTLDAVARESQVSKGGLLHHFPTKAKLLEGLSELAADIWTQRLERELTRESEGTPGRWCRAYIRATFEREAIEADLINALSRVVSAYPHVFDDTYDKSWLIPDDNDGLPPGRAITIQLACDGLWLRELSGMPPIPEADIRLVYQELIKLT